MDIAEKTTVDEWIVLLYMLVSKETGFDYHRLLNGFQEIVRLFTIMGDKNRNTIIGKLIIV